jgi:uncharacterized protein YxjI
MSELIQKLNEANHLRVMQLWEGFELLGFETRNKYQINSNNETNIAFAAEQSTGLGGAMMRQIFGHWRSFKVTIFDQGKTPVYQLNLPFRWFFKTLYVSEANGRRIGHLQQKFAIFRKKFTVYNVNGELVAHINSSFFRFWTFEFENRGRVIGKIQKQWSGMLSEVFTDKDNFLITFRNENMSTDMKALMLSMCLLIDIIYFENNQAGKNILNLID